MFPMRYLLVSICGLFVNVYYLFGFKVHFPRETSNMLLVSLKDTNGIKYAEDYIKLSVGQSSILFPTTVSNLYGFLGVVDAAIAVCTPFGIISAD